MASSGDTVMVIEKEKTGKARKSSATISGILPGKMDMAPVEAVDRIPTKKMRKPLPLVVVPDVLVVNKGSGSREALVETRKDIDKNQTQIRAVETGKDAVAVDKKQAEGSVSGKIRKFMRYQDISEGQADEEVLKEVAEMQEEISRIWRDFRNNVLRAGMKFADPA